MTTTEYTPRPLYSFVNLDCYWNQDPNNQFGGRLGRAPSWQVGLSYPSPPMSNPASPAQQSSHGSEDIEDNQDVTMLSIAPSEPSNNPNIKTSVSTAQTRPIRTRSSSPPIPGAGIPGTHTSPRPGLSQAQSSTQAETQPEISSQDVSAAQHAAAIASRSGRRSKSHVANACGNCKRAHLSCDVQRPCNRCVSTGKTVSLEYWYLRQ